MRHITILILVLVVSCLNTGAQESNPSLLRIGILDTSNVGISFYNDGQISGFNQGVDVRGDWRGNSYIGDMIPMIGLELPVKDYTGDGQPDHIPSVMISRGPRSRQSEERDPLTRQFRGFNPVRGFLDSSQTSIATSDNPSSWPDVWADHPEWGSGVWNGRTGPNTTVADREAYFQMDDSWDNEVYASYRFLPDSADTARKGHGIRVAVRYFQFNHPLFRDAIFFSYDIINTSIHTYEKVVWGSIVGTISGGDGDSQDDQSFIDNQNGFVYAYDADNSGNAGQRIGYAAEGILQSPSGDSLGSFNFFNISAAPSMDNDESLWMRLQPGRIDSLLPQPQDGDHMFGTNYFSMTPGETVHVAMVLALSDSLQKIRQSVLMARAFWYSGFDTTKLLHSLRFTNLEGRPVFSGLQTITWESADLSGMVDVWYSTDNGASWKLILSSLPNSGSYQINTEDLEDSPFARLRIFRRDIKGHPNSFTESPAFTVDNAGNGPPFVSITQPEIERGAVVDQHVLPMEFLACDPEYSPLTISIQYSSNKGVSFNPAITLMRNSDSLGQSIELDLSALRNSLEMVLRIEVSDGVSSRHAETEWFRKMTVRDTLHIGTGAHTGPAEVPFYINIVDSTAVRNHQYTITFDDSSAKRVTVVDATSGAMKIDREPFLPGVETSIFDGLTFEADDIITHLDTARSHFTGDSLQLPGYSFTRFLWSLSAPDEYNGYALPCDYEIVFYKTAVDSSVADTLYPPTPSNRIPRRPVNFIVINKSRGDTAKPVYFKTGTLSTVHNIYFKEESHGRLRRTWRVNIIYPTANAPLPDSGSLYLFTRKGLSSLDTIRISGLTAIGMSVEQTPALFHLYQNYPNPFNPVTRITYTVPVQSSVTLKIFNLLGQEVSTLVNGVEPTGPKSVEFDAAELASGVYFYRLQVGDFTGTKKLILIR